jgi:transcriptional regulator with XRE-family HTH domain
MIHEKTFKERLSMLIGDSGKQSFERKTGVSATNIRKYLKGDGLPTLKILGEIANANRVSIGWLIGEQEHLAETIHPHMSDRSMRDIAQWISEQNDGISYWEIAKAKLAQEFPEFKEWLKNNYSEESMTGGNKEDVHNRLEKL